MSKKRRPDQAGIVIHETKYDNAAREELEGEDSAGTTPAESPPAEGGEGSASFVRRPILKARRPGGGGASSSSSSSSANGEDEKPKENPFAGLKFGGIGSSSTSSLFGGGGLSANNNNSSSLFSTAPSSSTTSSSSLFPSSIASTSTTTYSSSSSPEDKSIQIAAMNRSFANWIQSQMATNPTGSWETGIRKYIEHCKSLGLDTSSTEELEEETAKANGFPLPNNKTKQPTTTTSAPSSTSTVAPLFPPSTSTTTATSAGSQSSLFQTTSSSLFAPASSNEGGTKSIFTGLSFGGGSSGSLFPSLGGGGSLFPSSSAAKPNQPPREDDEGDDGEDGEDEEPQEETTPVQKAENTEEDATFATDPAKVTVFRAEEKKWAGKGRGRLSVLKHKETRATRVVLNADTTGKVLFNAPLNSSMGASIKRDKAGVSIMTQSYSLVGGALEPDGKPALYRLVCKSETEAQGLEKALKEATASSG